MKTNCPFTHYLFFIFVLFCSCLSCKNSKEYVHSKKTFAKLKKDKFEFTIDTLKFKNEISAGIFSEDSKIIFDKVEIIKQFTLGEKSEIFYYVLLTDFDKKVTTAKWLYYDNGFLILNKKERLDDFFMIYLTCSGNQNCEPNVFIVDGKKKWVCGENSSCLYNDGINKVECEKFTTVFQ
ncbi:hypothetical protein [Flavobacterium sp.]|uniref:hypothetical protein n=1 Tax=Flavobacterium sp. TaxID=239 RepID=UPI002C489094|nr:hypothetical protein [Flavobacterium sp.]HQA73939.1 hypothetical protein [Flavobacterium sp.]